MQTPKKRVSNFATVGKPYPPDERTYKMLDGLLEGKAPVRACIDAGYTVAYARNFAVKMARSLRMKQAMLDYAKGIKPGELGDIAKVLVQANLTSKKAGRNAKEQLGYIRTALELDGQLGGPSELHLHQHSNLPPRVQKMLEDKMVELLEARKDQSYVDAIHAANPEGTESGGENQNDHGGIQTGRLALRVEDRPAGEKAQPSDCDCT